MSRDLWDIRNLKPSAEYSQSSCTVTSGESWAARALTTHYQTLLSFTLDLPGPRLIM